MTKLLTSLVLLCLPLYLVKIPLGELGSLSVLDIILVAAIFMQAFSIRKVISLSELFAQIRNGHLVLSALLLFLLGWIFAYLVNISGENWLDGLGLLKSFLFLPILFSLGTLLLIKKGLLGKRMLLLSFFASAAVQSFLGYFYVVQDNLTYDGRLALFYESPNQFAMILAPAILAGFSLLSKKRSAPLNSQNLQKTFIVIGITSLLFSLFFTQSLGAWIGLFMAFLGYFLLLKNKLIRKFSFSIFLCVLVFSLLLLNVTLLLNALGYKPSVPATPIDSRITIYQVSQGLASDNWVFGIGPGNFQKQYLEMQPGFAPFPQWAVPHAHNNLLQFLVEGGILVFLAFLVLLFLPLVSKRPTKKAALGFFVVVVYFLIHGIFDTTIWKNDTAILWWLSFVLSSKS